MILRSHQYLRFNKSLEKEQGQTGEGIFPPQKNTISFHAVLPDSTVNYMLVRGKNILTT